MITRRHLLAVAAAVGTAGCTGALGDSGEPNPGDADRLSLEELSVQNNHGGDHRILLAVEVDGEITHLGTYDLEGDGGSRKIEGEWSDDARSYRIHARLDDGDVWTEDVTDGIGGGADCVRVLVRIDSDGDLAVWNGSNCGPTGEDPDLEEV